MSTLALVDVDALDLGTGQGFEIDDDGAEGVAVQRVSMQGLGIEDEPASLWLVDRGGDGDLAAELTSEACSELTSGPRWQWFCSPTRWANARKGRSGARGPASAILRTGRGSPGRAGC